MTLTRPNALVNLTLPALVVGLAYLGLPQVQHLPQVLGELLPYLPYLLAILVIGLGLILERQRIVMISLLLALGYWVYRWSAALPPQQGDLYYLALSIFLPLNLAWMGAREERGLFSPHGLVAWVALLVQVTALAWVLERWPGPAFSLLAFEVILEPRLAQLTPLPQLGLASLTVALLWTLTGVFRQRSILIGGQLGALAAFALALHLYRTPAAGPVLFSVAFLCLAAALAYHSYYLAYVDELTNLPGRRAFNETLRRLRGQYTVAMLDVDHFKSFNDTYGHDVGDQVLRMVAARIRQVGGGGKAFRYGGEEFSIIFPNKGVKQAFPYLSNVREAVDRSHMVIRSPDRPAKKPRKPKRPRGPMKQVHVTISIGMAEPEREGQDPEEVVKAADKALYRAKEKGRNRLST